ncbi:MAG: Gfo/Idh/MocA family oxidoreductase [Phycisphaeraceae bacterium]|nr:Gfo/Idh/MocA family oxidoreductase [Phycisphaeraceae bacterium]
MEASERARQKNRKITRREFVRGSASTAAAFTIVQSSILTSSAASAPSERINLACIGVGDMGRGDMEELMAVDGVQVVAICDIAREVDYRDMGHGIAGRDPAIRRVNDHYAHDNKSGSYKGCIGYEDFREMLDVEGDRIDAVCVATPDHVHAAACLAAIGKGKHVYCEKPLAHSIYETRLVTEAARKAGVMTQMGNHGHSGSGIRLAVEWIRDGAIGQVREVHGGDNTGAEDWLRHRSRPKEAPPVPQGWNWDLWCGPASYRPYHPAYAPYNWRGWWDFGNGCIGDMACHNLDPAFWALDLGAPTSVQATSTGFTEETVPAGAIYHYEFPARGSRPGLTLKWYSGKERVPSPPTLEKGRRGSRGLYFVGDEGVLTMDGWAENPRLIPDSKMRAYKQPPKSLPRVRGHHSGWIDAIRSGEPVHGGFDYSGPMTETVLLGAVALRTGKKLVWDSKNMKAGNAPEADKFIKPVFRDGWNL